MSLIPVEDHTAHENHDLFSFLVFSVRYWNFYIIPLTCVWGDVFDSYYSKSKAARKNWEMIYCRSLFRYQGHVNSCFGTVFVKISLNWLLIPVTILCTRYLDPAHSPKDQAGLSGILPFVWMFSVSRAPTYGYSLKEVSSKQDERFIIGT